MSEGGHWYKRDGSPCYEVPKKDGGMRAVNLAWDRKLGLVPSVTTVLRVLAKDALETWKVRQGILAALTLTREPGESDESFLARVLEDSRQQAKDAADEGTRVHDQIERSFKGLVVEPRYVPHVTAVGKEIERLFPGIEDWEAEAYFAHPSGFGGKVDLHSPSTGIVIDYKGKDGDFTDGKKLAYDQHYQLAAYQRGLILPASPCANVFFSRTHPGAVASYKWTVEDIANGWDVFESALTLWKRVKKYDGAFSLDRVAA